MLKLIKKFALVLLILLHSVTPSFLLFYLQAVVTVLNSLTLLIPYSISFPSSQTGITFQNEVKDNDTMNIFNYHNFYNGGGVAIGDINNDGKPDIFFTSNQHDNKLYLNKGNWKFEDITAKAGLVSKHQWHTGVTMADVNGDGWLDIYVCNAGIMPGDDNSNELYINQKNGTLQKKPNNMVWTIRAYLRRLLFLITTMMATWIVLLLITVTAR